MIKLMTRTARHAFTDRAFVQTWTRARDIAATRPANHNLTLSARMSNVVPIGGGRGRPDFRPDLGARLRAA